MQGHNNYSDKTVRLGHKDPSDESPKEELHSAFTALTGRARYSIEHDALKTVFYRDPRLIMDKAVSDPHGLFNFYKTTMELSGIPVPYTKEQFRTEKIIFTDGDIMVLAELPGPERMPLCHRIYMVTDGLYEKPAYFTIERSLEDACLCMWDNLGRHMNIRNIAPPVWTDTRMKEEEIRTVIGLYNDMFPKKTGIFRKKKSGFAA